MTMLALQEGVVAECRGTTIRIRRQADIMKIDCPKCGNPMSLASRADGEAVTCTNPKCRHIFQPSSGSSERVTGPGAVPPPPPVQAPPIQYRAQSEGSTRTSSARQQGEIDELRSSSRVFFGRCFDAFWGWCLRALTATQRGLHKLQLTRDLRRLEKKEDNRLEALGVRVAQIRPTGLSVDGQFAELDQLRADLRSKESERKVLEKSGGDRASIRRAQAEIGALEQREYGVLKTLGQEALAARLRLSDDDDYESLLEVQQRRAAIEEELRKLEVDTTSTSGGFTAVPGRAWVLAASLVAMILLVWLLLSAFAGTPVVAPDWAEFAVSGDASHLLQIDLSKLQGGEVLHRFMESLPSQASRFPGGLEVEDLRRVFVVIGDQGRLIVAQSHEEFLVEEFASNRAAPQVFRKFQYVPFSCDAFQEGYLAQTGDRTFSLAASEDELRKLLTRMDEGEIRESGKELGEAARAVSHQDHYAALMVNGDSEAAHDVIGLGLGMSIDGSTVDMSGVFVFRTARSAGQFLEDFQDVIDDWEEEIRQGAGHLSGEAQSGAEQGLELFRDASLRRRDKTVHFRGRWGLEEIEDLVGYLPQIVRLF